MELLILLFLVGLLIYIGVLIGRRLGRAEGEVELTRRVSELEQRHRKEMDDLWEWAREEIERARHEAVEAARNVLAGKVGERIAPLLAGFPVRPDECCFVNYGIDYLGLPGYNENDIREIVLIEVKTGKSSLHQRQRQLRDCVKLGKVRFVLYNATTQEVVGEWTPSITTSNKEPGFPTTETEFTPSS